MKLSMQSISNSKSAILVDDTNTVYQVAEQRRLILEQIDRLEVKIALDRQKRWNKILKELPSK